MAMTWNSLTASKGSPGSIANWVAYTKLDINPIVDEAQALLFSILRCREMRSVYYFTLTQGQAAIALPPNFLDPIGRIECPSINLSVRYYGQNEVMLNRNFTETTGTLGTNALTTSSGSNIIAVNLPGHGFNQESIFFLQGAAAFNGITPNGTFPISSIIDVNNFNIDVTVLGTTPNASGSGGGAAMTYVCDNLVQVSIEQYSIWDEAIHFDGSALQTMLMQLSYFKSLPLLSSTNPSNFLTNRYPHLLRQACVTSAADFMKDDAEYTKGQARLTAMVQQVNIENDMMYRGSELMTDTP